jgi:hypothetical protein
VINRRVILNQSVGKTSLKHTKQLITVRPPKAPGGFVVFRPLFD